MRIKQHERGDNALAGLIQCEMLRLFRVKRLLHDKYCVQLNFFIYNYFLKQNKIIRVFKY